MPIYTLQNQELTAQFASRGAELKSLKDNRTGQEYMWCGDAAYWGRTSPVLFPLVGACKNNEYTHQGKQYSMSQHGFARDMEFSLLTQTGDSLWFGLSETEETLAKYPFAVRLELGYRLEGRSLTVLWRVKNPGRETLYFSIGGHPAFNCPLKPGERQTDYSLLFDAKDKLVSRVLEPWGVTDERREFSLADGRLPITADLFDRDALIVEDHQAHRVSLVRPEGETYLTVEFEATLFGIWSPKGKQAPFVCIEPWYGRADHMDFQGELCEREWGNRLEPEETFEAIYRIVVE